MTSEISSPSLADGSFRAPISSLSPLVTRSTCPAAPTTRSPWADVTAGPLRRTTRHRLQNAEHHEQRHQNAEHVRQQVLRGSVEQAGVVHVGPGPVHRLQDEADRERVCSEPVSILREVRVLDGKNGAAECVDW